jgi:DNA-binding NarL/FixJ family response regulator
LASAIRILVIDDRAVIRSALQQLVGRRASIDVIGSTSKDGTPLDAALAAAPDVVLLSAGRDPGRDVTTLSSIRAAAPSARILVLAETREFPTLEQAIRLGAHGVVSRETTTETLIKAIKSVNAGEYWMDRRLAAMFVGEASSAAGVDRAATRSRSGVGALTPRERDVISLIARGLRNKEIARSLGISETTVRHHLTSTFTKLEVSDRLSLVIYAFQRGLAIPTLGRFIGASEPEPDIQPIALPSRTHRSVRRPVALRRATK